MIASIKMVLFREKDFSHQILGTERARAESALAQEKCF